MEGLFVIVIIGFIIIHRNINAKFKGLEQTIMDLHRRIRLLQEKITSQEISSREQKQTSYDEKKTKDKTTNTPYTTDEPSFVIPEKSIPETIKPVDKKEPLVASIAKEKQKLNKTEEQPEQKKEVPAPKKPWFETFKEKNPDLEKFIGENLISKIGILILVLGISFFVKYAIDKDWINEPARVGIGILSGALVMIIAHKLKKNYTAFSSVLVAGAISIFYFTIYIAFHDYQLFNQTVAFIIMAVITAFSAFVSVSYNRQELAVLSLIGGFAAPFMLSTGKGNYIVLFSYIAILNIGILAISYFKKWRIATILSFVFTIILFGSWNIIEIGAADFSHKGALFFATLFYFIFSITIVLSNLRNKGVFSTIEYFILIANSFFFFGIGMMILKDLNSNFTGLFTLSLGIYNISYAAILYRKFGLDKNAVYLLIGLALTFATLTIPIQFEGNQITIFWSLEAVLLFWLSKKSKLNSFKIGAIIVQLLALISLLIDWKRYSTNEEFNIIINPLFITGLLLSVSLFVSYRLLKKEEDFYTQYFTVPIQAYKRILIIITIIVSYFTGILEINYQANQFLTNAFSALSFPTTYHFVFVSAILYVSSLFKNKKILKGALIISVASIISYILYFYKLATNEMIENFIINTNTKSAFYLHYIILGCLVYFGYQLFKNVPLVFNVKNQQSKWLPWAFVFVIVYVLSNEIMIHGLQFSDSVNTVELTKKFSDVEAGSYSYDKTQFVRNGIDNTKKQIIKIGYPILWGLFSFIFLIIGIKKQWKTLRIIALSLLGLTILKLFIYDIKNVSETGKIIAFILLGVLILVISFVYQKIKKLVVDEETVQNNGSNKEE